MNEAAGRARGGAADSRAARTFVPLRYQRALPLDVSENNHQVEDAVLEDRVLAVTHE